MMHAAGSGETRKFSQAHFTPPEFEFDSFTPGGNTYYNRSFAVAALFIRPQDKLHAQLRISSSMARSSGQNYGFSEDFLIPCQTQLPSLQSSIFFYTYANLELYSTLTQHHLLKVS